MFLRQPEFGVLSIDLQEAPQHQLLAECGYHNSVTDTRLQDSVFAVLQPDNPLGIYTGWLRNFGWSFNLFVILIIAQHVRCLFTTRG